MFSQQCNIIFPEMKLFKGITSGHETVLVLGITRCEVLQCFDGVESLFPIQFPPGSVQVLFLKQFQHHHGIAVKRAGDFPLSFMVRKVRDHEQYAIQTKSL